MMMKMNAPFSILLLVLSLSSEICLGWMSPTTSSITQTSKLSSALQMASQNQDPSECIASRRSFVTSSVLSAIFAGFSPLANADENEDFSSIAARAAKISKDIQREENIQANRGQSASSSSGDKRTAYDFSLPIAGEAKSFADVIRQEFPADEGERPKVKAILVVNMKQDDPVARKDIPEMISLAAKFGRSGEFAVISCPTDQGYYEPDTSTLIRLKLASEYGYGINPATVVTDKMNLLGTGAHPFWRWLEGNCRTPSGLGKIEANFEKFLIDGTTGKPLRRYPRKYQPINIQNDIDAVIAGKPLPPAGANFLEEWRTAAVAAQADTYRFQKGLNYFDQ